MKIIKNNPRDGHTADLLDRYFEGTTTVAEEKELRLYFSTAPTLPQEWHYLLPLLAPQRAQDFSTQTRKRKLSWKQSWGWISVAASLGAVLIGYGAIHSWHNSSESYAIVNGKKMYDSALIEQYALNALQDVAWEEEEVSLKNLLI